VGAGETRDTTELQADALRRAFDSTSAFTVGLEEEVMLLDPETLDLAPRAAALLERLDGDRRFTSELPASQLEIRTEPAETVEAAVEQLAQGRQDLARAADGLAVPAVAGVHPFAAGEGEVSRSERYDRIRAEFGSIARRQLVASLQVHVAVGDAERTLGVYNALRAHLPDMAAVAANAPFYEGRDSGMASVRPKVAELLPRQGMPPAIESWRCFVAELSWGAAAGGVTDPGLWWWELRPHPGFGTLEIRVPDAQTTIADAAGIAALGQALVAWLADRGDRRDAAAAPATWRIEENRWSAARHGLDGQMADLVSGRREATRARLAELVAALEPIAARLGSSSELGEVKRLIEENGAARQRRVADERGLRGLAAWLAHGFSR
jgi:glutamate---cysteine ligase / carboxylate-amine ligase